MENNYTEKTTKNIMATLGIVALLFINVFLLVGFGGIFSATAILLPLVLIFSNGAFMSTYAAYYKIKEVMIDPYVTPEETPSEGCGDGEFDEDGFTEEGENA